MIELWRSGETLKLKPLDVSSLQKNPYFLILELHQKCIILHSFLQTSPKLVDCGTLQMTVQAYAQAHAHPVLTTDLKSQAARVPSPSTQKIKNHKQDRSHCIPTHHCISSASRFPRQVCPDMSFPRRAPAALVISGGQARRMNVRGRRGGKFTHARRAAWCARWWRNA